MVEIAREAEVMEDSTMWMVITEVENGFKLKMGDCDGDGNPITRRLVLEEPEHFSDETERDAKLISKLLWQVVEYFQMGGTKHDSHRISISIVRKDGEQIGD